ncbi:hypothetical protein [Natronosalvus amylolyticus]|uniref:hypothetical protein n=1 Tax=Natronosalvus amylolyticus TaxID=2961994 RepID=UPI0020C9613F|nr:hypothetical protein [Natronosalvus amylolyticus]
MDTIPIDGDLVGKTSGTVAHPPYYEDQTVEVRVYRNVERNLLLLERRYPNCTLVSEFDILSTTTVRSRVDPDKHPKYVLRAVAAMGFDTIKQPE